jgi:hypothetical protein
MILGKIDSWKIPEATPEEVEDAFSEKVRYSSEILCNSSF